MISGIGIEEGFPRTVATEEQKRKLGGLGLGDLRANVMRLDSPPMWSFSKLRRRMLKFTAQAAWMIKVVLRTKEA